MFLYQLKVFHKLLLILLSVITAIWVGKRLKLILRDAY